jgi:hypothetical protein
VWPRQREQYLRSSKRLGSLRRFFCRGIIPFPTAAALQRYDLPNVSRLLGHFLIQ